MDSVEEQFRHWATGEGEDQDTLSESVTAVRSLMQLKFNKHYYIIFKLFVYLAKFQNTNCCSRYRKKQLLFYEF